MTVAADGLEAGAARTDSTLEATEDDDSLDVQELQEWLGALQDKGWEEALDENGHSDVKDGKHREDLLRRLRNFALYEYPHWRHRLLQCRRELAARRRAVQVVQLLQEQQSVLVQEQVESELCRRFRSELRRFVIEHRSSLAEATAFYRREVPERARSSLIDSALLGRLLADVPEGPSSPAEEGDGEGDRWPWPQRDVDEPLWADVWLCLVHLHSFLERRLEDERSVGGGRDPNLPLLAAASAAAIAGDASRPDTKALLRWVRLLDPVTRGGTADEGGGIDGEEAFPSGGGGAPPALPAFEDAAAREAAAASRKAALERSRRLRERLDRALRDLETAERQCEALVQERNDRLREVEQLRAALLGERGPPGAAL